MIQEKEVARFFDKAGPEYEEARYAYVRNLRADITRQNILGDVVLDVGCNYGHHMGAYFTGNKKIVGLDISLQSVLHAKKFVPAASFVNASAAALPFKQKVFDTVVSSEMIYYMEKPQEFLNNLHRCMKPNGKLILLCSNDLYGKLGGIIGPLLRLRAKDCVDRTFFPWQVIRMLKKAGYSNITHKAWGVIPFKGFEFVDKFFPYVFKFYHCFTCINGMPNLK